MRGCRSLAPRPRFAHHEGAALMSCRSSLIAIARRVSADTPAARVGCANSIGRLPGGVARLLAPVKGANTLIYAVAEGEKETSTDLTAGRGWPSSTTVRSASAPGKPERRGQGQGEHEVAAQLELAGDQESLGAGSTADQPQERHRFKLERQRRPASAAS